MTWNFNTDITGSVCWKKWQLRQRRVHRRICSNNNAIRKRTRLCWSKTILSPSPSSSLKRVCNIYPYAHTRTHAYNTYIHMYTCILRDRRYVHACVRAANSAHFYTTTFWITYSQLRISVQNTYNWSN